MSLTDEDKQWINAQFERVETALNSRIERVETALLTEFHKWASPAEMRARSHSAVLRVMDLEVVAGAERVTKRDSRDTQ